jgi:hypothetical protein
MGCCVETRVRKFGSFGVEIPFNEKLAEKFRYARIVCREESCRNINFGTLMPKFRYI